MICYFFVIIQVDSLGHSRKRSPLFKQEACQNAVGRIFFLQLTFCHSVVGTAAAAMTRKHVKRYRSSG